MENLKKPSWREETEQTNGSIQPLIINFPQDFLQRKHKSRFILTTSDISFLISNHKYLDKHEESPSKTPILCGIYFSFDEINASKIILKQLSNKYNYKKIYFFGFYSKILSLVLRKISGSDTKWDYTINYIRTARFNLVKPIWDLLELSEEDATINKIATYVTDLDVFSRGDFDKEIIKVYGDKCMLISWNGDKSPNKYFPNNLAGSGWAPEQDSTSTSNCALVHSTKIIKATFSCFAPSSLSKLFLNFYKDYSIGGDISNKEPIYMRLFTFYYGDQASLVFSLLDIKNLSETQYKTKIGWIDLSTSNIVNLSLKFNPLLFTPKGVKDLITEEE